MEFKVYILRSGSTGRHYCGSTNNISRRLRQHNDPHYSLSKTTKRFRGPWVLIWSKPFSTRSEAMREEKRIKKRGIMRYLEDAQQAESRPGRD